MTAATTTSQAHMDHGCARCSHLLTTQGSNVLRPNISPTSSRASMPMGLQISRRAEPIKFWITLNDEDQLYFIPSYILIIQNFELTATSLTSHLYMYYFFIYVACMLVTSCKIALQVFAVAPLDRFNIRTGASPLSSSTTEWIITRKEEICAMKWSISIILRLDLELMWEPRSMSEI